ncbi:unnamed protein product [Polarella glacialis]|uniref:Uncharacterized protein n=1 Tax=Polarella glacialis TaxID=89957 RepID=A0A813HCY4_POLGL|nr:unnamed protein product [Polarella glacialis]
MDPTPELLAKLSRRLRAVEGESAEAAEAARRAQRTPGPLAEAHSAPPPSRLFQSSSTWSQSSRPPSSDNEELVSTQACRGRRRRVRVPSWVVDASADSVSAFSPELHRQAPWLMTSGTSSSSSTPTVAGALSSQPGYRRQSTGQWKNIDRTLWSAEQVEADLRSRLEIAKKERDAAERSAENAQAAARSWGDELASEAQRLRELYAKLSGEFHVTESEVNERRGSAGQATSEAHGSAGGQLEAVQRDVRHLGVQLYGLGTSKTSLAVRSGSLEVELQRQIADCADLQQRLEASRASETELEARLEQELLDSIMEDQASLEVIMATPERPTSTRSPLNALGSFATPTGSGVLPPASSMFAFEDSPDELAEGNESDEGSEEAAGQLDDLEFAYDWGLQLSGRMSVERALQLARRWAAGAEGGMEAVSTEAESDENGDEQRGSAPKEAADDAAQDEEHFEVPLADLMDALAVLQGASAARAASNETASRRPGEEAMPKAEEVQDTDEFESPVADLQKVLARLGASPGSPGQAAPSDVENKAPTLRPLNERTPPPSRIRSRKTSPEADASCCMLSFRGNLTVSAKGYQYVFLFVLLVLFVDTL